MTRRDVLTDATRRLSAAGIESARLEAELLLEHVLDQPRLKLSLDLDRHVLPTAEAAFAELIQQRRTRIPLQHLTGWAPFLEHRLRVTRDTLIPRPETETLALLALEILRAHPECGRAGALDFGTGSGCLALALAAAVPGLAVTAVELSPAAAAVAQDNFHRAGVPDRIHLVTGDGFLTVPSLGRRFGLIVTNPPYIPEAEIAELSPEVRDHDPRQALVGGLDGLDYYRRMAREGRHWLEPEGWLLAEFGDGQGPDLAREFSKQGWNAVRVEKDLSGRPRVLIVRAPAAA
jgi:release factor glutamine methyltransferase